MTSDREVARHECPWCQAHPHRQACSLDCEDARVTTARREQVERVWKSAFAAVNAIRDQLTTDDALRVWNALDQERSKPDEATTAN